MSEMKLPKTIRGKRPQIFEDRGVDYVMAIALALAEEVSALRDRLDLVERVAHDKGIFLADEIESYQLDDAALAARERRRQAYLDRLFTVYQQEQSELGKVDSAEKYQELLDEFAEQ